MINRTITRNRKDISRRERFLGRSKRNGGQTRAYECTWYKNIRTGIELVTTQIISTFEESNAPESKYLGKKQSTSLEQAYSI